MEKGSATDNGQQVAIYYNSNFFQIDMIYCSVLSLRDQGTEP